MKIDPTRLSDQLSRHPVRFELAGVEHCLTEPEARALIDRIEAAIAGAPKRCGQISNQGHRCELEAGHDTCGVHVCGDFGWIAVEVIG